MTNTLHFVRQLGQPEQFRASAENNVAMQPQPANTHIHLPPNFSAFGSVAQAVKLAAEQGLRVLGAGNYYDFAVYEEFGNLCRQNGIFPLFSTEMIAFEPEMAEANIRVNDPGNPGKIYLCGKGIAQFSPMSNDAAEHMTAVRNNDAARMKAMIDTMTARFQAAGCKIALDEQAVIGRVAKRHDCEPKAVTLQERHVAQAFQEVFFETVPDAQRAALLTELYGCAPKAATDDAVGTQNDIRSFLMKAGKPCFVPESFGRLEQSHALIGRLGGIPCYPVLADGAPAACEYETPVERLIERLQKNNFVMAEFIPVRNQPEALMTYATALRKAGIVLTAGTEHNTLDLIPLIPRCADGSPVPEKAAAWFWEGVCVTAAHLYRVANGQTGFVDEQGRPNPEWSNAEDRITAFAQLGQLVLNAFYERYPQ